MNKLFIGMIFLVMSINSYAWDKVISCESDTFIIDKDCSIEGSFPEKINCSFQAVINNFEIVKYMFNKDLDQVVFNIEAESGYGNFVSGMNSFLDVAKIKISDVGNGRIKVTTYNFYYGLHHRLKDWIFKDCNLLMSY